MQFALPLPVTHIVATLRQAGFTCEIVGGAVRDLMLGKPTKDWDFTTNAKPEEILPLFSGSFCENAFGTVMVAQKHLKEQFHFESDPAHDELVYDITTYRTDGTYENYRHPTSVTWGTSIDEDLKRRDFTINAMALRSQGQDYELIDPYMGQTDLSNHLIRTVGDPSARLTEDALRMLRAVRFSVQLDMKLEAATAAAIRANAPLLANISQERIGEETMKMLASPHPTTAIRTLDNLGLLEFVIPELLATKNVKQAGHHIYDVWEHSLRALENCPSPDPVVRLAALLHDIAKPQTFHTTAKGDITFYSHEVIGARTAKAIAARLRLSKQDCDLVFTLVRWHMFVYEKNVTDAYIRRFIRRVGVGNLEAMMAVRTADRVGSGSKASSWRLEELQDRIYSELHQPLQLKDMAIDGNDIMKNFSIKPGPRIGKLLNTLFEEVISDPSHNNKEYLTTRLQELIDSGM